MRAANHVMLDVLAALQKLRRPTREILGTALWLEMHGVIEGAEMGFCGECGELFPADHGCPHAPRCNRGPANEG